MITGDSLRLQADRDSERGWGRTKKVFQIREPEEKTRGQIDIFETLEAVAFQVAVRINRQAWREARLSVCPLHTGGGCGLVRHPRLAAACHAPRDRADASKCSPGEGNSRIQTLYRPIRLPHG